MKYGPCITPFWIFLLSISRSLRRSCEVAFSSALKLAPKSHSRRRWRHGSITWQLRPCSVCHPTCGLLQRELGLRGLLQLHQDVLVRCAVPHRRGQYPRHYPCHCQPFSQQAQSFGTLSLSVCGHHMYMLPQESSTTYIMECWKMLNCAYMLKSGQIMLVLVGDIAPVFLL